MIRNASLATAFGVAMICAMTPASARGLEADGPYFCASCAPRGVLLEPGVEAVSYRARRRGDAWSMYDWRPYTRTDIEGIRIIERMR